MSKSGWVGRTATEIAAAVRDGDVTAREVTREHLDRIASIETFDMFPQTAHVETVCELAPAA